MAKWAKLTNEQLATLGFSTYPGEVVLIDYKKTPVTDESFYWNAQQFFSDAELEKMSWFSSELFEQSTGGIK